MADEVASSVSNHNSSNGYVVDIYPLNGYYFGSKESIPDKDETLADRVQKLKTNYAANGLRTCVEGVILHVAAADLVNQITESLKLSLLGTTRNSKKVELFKHPHLLVLQVRNSFYKLPGGRLRPGESDIDGLKRKLSSKLSVNEHGNDNEWEVGECLGMWWRPNFETLIYPYLPPNTRRPKECTKLFLVKLPASRKFIVPGNLKLLAVPLCQIHENQKTYGPIISGVPQLLSRFSFNIIER